MGGVVKPTVLFDLFIIFMVQLYQNKTIGQNIEFYEKYV
jgi:hypothetical protein